MGRVRLVLRFGQIVLLCTVALLSYFVERVRQGFRRASLERARGRALTLLFERLGATFVKFGQILSTRPDILGPGYIAELARLQDQVPPAPFAEIRKVLDADLTEEARSRLKEIDEVPVAAASVAQVHRAVMDDGRVVALKIQRPAARSQIERDLVILAAGARLVDLIPAARMLSLPGAVGHFGEALAAQLDFEAEARNNRRFARNFRDVEGVDVPDLVDELCSPRVLGMEFIDGVKATEPEKVGGDPEALARGGAECILKMVFADGFVHADLHPGNILLTADDQVVLLDFGLVTEIPPELMRPWVQTFIALAQQDGHEAARLFYSYAPSVGPDVHYEEFERDVVAHFESLYGKKLSEVEVSEAVGGLMNVLRRHRIQVDSTFTVVNIAMLVAEGLGKQLHADIDLVEVAAPYLMQALADSPEPMPPPRTPPVASPSSCGA